MASCSPTTILATIMFIIAGVVLVYGGVQSYRQTANFNQGLEAFAPYFLIAIVLALFGLNFLRGGT